MKKRVYIIHGWGGSPSSDWYPWLKKKLEEKNFEVVLPEMPDTDKPQIDKWVGHLKEIVKEPDENTFFVGHSIGCQTILRYLETLENKKIGGAVFVAGWFNLENLEENEKAVVEQWIKVPMNFAKIKNSLSNKLTVLLSDNEPYDCVEENKKMFESELGAEVIVLKNKGHFTSENGFDQLSEALGAVLKLAKSRTPPQADGVLD